MRAFTPTTSTPATATTASTSNTLRSSLRFELLAMALVVLMAGVSVFATIGSARSSDIVFCQLADGEVVVGVTTDCIGAVPAAVAVPVDNGASGEARATGSAELAKLSTE